MAAKSKYMAFERTSEGNTYILPIRNLAVQRPLTFLILYFKIPCKNIFNILITHKYQNVSTVQYTSVNET